MYFPCFIYTVRVDVTISSFDQTTVKYQEVVRIYIVYLTEYGGKSAQERERERFISASFIIYFETPIIVIICAPQLVL